MAKKSEEDVFGAPRPRETGATAGPRQRNAEATRSSGDSNNPRSVMVMLRPSQVASLDHLSADIRQHSGLSIKRAELIRGMIDAVEELGLGAVLIKRARVAPKLNDTWVKDTLKQVLSPVTDHLG